MPNYINKALVRFWHPPAWKDRINQTLMSSPNVGQKCNIYKKKTNPAPLMRLERNSYKRYAVFSFPHTCGWQRTTPVLSSLASQQVNPTDKTIELCKQFLDYMATQEDAILTYCTSDMVLTITEMHHTYPNPNPTDTRVDTCSGRKGQHTLQ